MVIQSLKSLSAPRLSIRFRQYVDLLVDYLRPQTGLVAIVAVLLFTSIGLQLVNPQIIRFFIDEALAGSPVSRLIAAAALFTVIALLQQVVDVLTTYTGGRVGWTATNALRADLAKHCLSLDMSFHNDRTPGEMIERIDGDANELGGFFSIFVSQSSGQRVAASWDTGSPVPRGLESGAGLDRIHRRNADGPGEHAPHIRSPFKGGAGR